jgi:hypothetical protein
MLDMDHFKDFNDRYGHPGGDVALRSFSDVLRSCMRDGDGVNGLAATAIAERIRERAKEGGRNRVEFAPAVLDTPLPPTIPNLAKRSA